MEYNIQVKQVPAQLAAVIRLRAQLSELSTVVPQACGEVWTFLRSSNFPRPGRNLSVYLDDEINLEVGVEVFKPFAGNDRVVCSSTPAGMAATAVHMGPYDRLGDEYTAIHQWAGAHGQSLARPCWEVYGHWNDDPAQLRTDVFYLIRQDSAQSPPADAKPVAPQGP
jgi:effector-binding domain-containing protein